MYDSLKNNCNENLMFWITFGIGFLFGVATSVIVYGLIVYLVNIEVI